MKTGIRGDLDRKISYRFGSNIAQVLCENFRRRMSMGFNLESEYCQLSDGLKPMKLKHTHTHTTHTHTLVCS